MVKLQLTDLDVNNKRVLIRVDFNVPLDDAGEITDNTRIRAALPTIEWVIDHGGEPILMSHLGRPKGEVVPKLSLAPVAKRLGELLGKQVALFELGQEPPDAPVLLLENLRFHAAETKPDLDPSFAEQLAKLGDVYVNDAFGTAHRKHSSTFTITRFFPKTSAAGFLLQKEIEFLGDSVLHPKRPFAAIIGGAKVSTKLGVLKSLVDKVDLLLVGGGMAFTFFKAQGIDIGNSLVEEELIPEAKEVLASCKNLHLPVDLRIAQKIDEDVETRIIRVEEGIPDGWMGLDAGPATMKGWSELLAPSKTILWNGPLGVFEVPPFDKGTLEMAYFLASSDATTIVGGGDSVAAIHKAGVSQKISHISTGGGASLEYIEEGTLPGLEALTTKTAADIL